jgi:hypothetical protein
VTGINTRKRKQEELNSQPQRLKVNFAANDDIDDIREINPAPKGKKKKTKKKNKKGGKK